MKRLAIFLLLGFLFSPSSYAAKIANVNLSWVNPTLNTDGTPITDLIGIEVNWGTCGATANTMGTILGHVNVPDTGSTTTTTVSPTNVTSFPICFVLRAYNGYGNYSVYSNVAEKAIPTLGIPTTLGKPILLPPGTININITILHNKSTHGV